MRVRSGVGEVRVRVRRKLVREVVTVRVEVNP